MGVIDRVHVVMWRSRDGSVWIDGELDVDVQGGVGGGSVFIEESSTGRCGLLSGTQAEMSST